MFAIITSTIIPEAHSYFSVEDRYLQTINTINLLRLKGFEIIFLIDNSKAQIDSFRLVNSTFNNLKIIQTPQYTFENKGLNEALLILNNLSHFPENENIFKISGRYYPNSSFDKKTLLKQLGNKEILGICSNIDKDIPFFSTRSYLVKNKRILEEILLLVIDEMIAYGRDINGFKSLIKKINSIHRPSIGTPFKLSLEQSFARVIKNRKNYVLAKAMNIEGFVAGSSHKDFISE